MQRTGTKGRAGQEKSTKKPEKSLGYQCSNVVPGNPVVGMGGRGIYYGLLGVGVALRRNGRAVGGEMAMGMVTALS